MEKLEDLAGAFGADARNLAEVGDRGPLDFLQGPEMVQQGAFAGPGGFGGGQQGALTTWVAQHCKTVPTNLWQPASTSSATGGRGFGFGGATQLYDCAAARLHEEIILVTAAWMEAGRGTKPLRPFGTIREEATIDQLTQALRTPRSPAANVVERIRRWASQDATDLEPELQRRAAAQKAAAIKHLAEVGEAEAKSLQRLLEDQRARIAKAERQYRQATFLLSAGESRLNISVDMDMTERIHYERDIAALKAYLGEEEFTQARNEGHKMTPEQAIAVSNTPRASSNTKTHKFPLYPDGLTAREVEILRFVAQGWTDTQVAEKLIISPRTVQGHLRSIYNKIDVTSRSAATRYAFEHNLV